MRTSQRLVCGVIQQSLSAHTDVAAGAGSWLENRLKCYPNSPADTSFTLMAHCRPVRCLQYCDEAIRFEGRGCIWISRSFVCIAFRCGCIPFAPGSRCSCRRAKAIQFGSRLHSALCVFFEEVWK